MAPADRPEALLRVAARVREHVAAMAPVVEALQEALARWSAGPQDRIHVHWVGGLLHDIYTGLERCFSTISPELNGLEGAPLSWHRELLHAMTLDMPGFRPRVIAATREPELVELMKFRHVYRNLYSFDLDWTRIRPLAERAVRMWPGIAADLDSFARALERIAAGGATGS